MRRAVCQLWLGFLYHSLIVVTDCTYLPHTPICRRVICTHVGVYSVCVFLAAFGFNLFVTSPSFSKLMYVTLWRLLSETKQHRSRRTRMFQNTSRPTQCSYIFHVSSGVKCPNLGRSLPQCCPLVQQHSSGSSLINCVNTLPCETQNANLWLIVAAEKLYFSQAVKCSYMHGRVS